MRSRAVNLLAVASAILLTQGAHAQEAADAKGKDSRDIEEIVVTGTRIVRDGYTAPTPVTVARADANAGRGRPEQIAAVPDVGVPGQGAAQLAQ
jgi:hypothetical protein